LSEPNRIIPKHFQHQGPTGPSHWNAPVLSALPLPVFIGIVAIFNFVLPPTAQFDRSLAFEPPLLNAVLYTVFLASTSCIVAFIALKSYLENGRPFLVLLGAGALAWGSGSLLGGWLTNLPSGPNPAVTISNTGALVASIFHVASAGINKRPSVQTALRNRKPILILAYAGVLLFTSFYALAALEGMVPPFFVPGIGQTLLRMTVLGLAVTLFGVSALLFARLYPKAKSGTLYWYFLSLALTSVGLASVFFGRAPGDPISWTGRSAMFLGGVYLIKAVFFVFKEHHI